MLASDRFKGGLGAECSFPEWIPRPSAAALEKVNERLIMDPKKPARTLALQPSAYHNQANGPRHRVCVLRHSRVLFQSIVLLCYCGRVKESTNKVKLSPTDAFWFPTRTVADSRSSYSPSRGRIKSTWTLTCFPISFFRRNSRASCA